MEALTIFISGLAISAALAAGMVRYLEKPLHFLLMDLCGTEQRARFWTTYAKVMLLAFPLLLAAVYVPGPKSSWNFFVLIEQVRAALLAILAGGGVLGAVLGRIILKGQNPGNA